MQSPPAVGHSREILRDPATCRRRHIVGEPCNRSKAQVTDLCTTDARLAVQLANEQSNMVALALCPAVIQSEKDEVMDRRTSLFQNLTLRRLKERFAAVHATAG